MLLANIVNKAGGNLEEFTIFQSTANRLRKKEVGDKAANIREDFLEKIGASGKEQILHFDTKCVIDFTGSL